jgi:hypothetical protein
MRKYDWQSAYINGFAKIYLNGKYGFIDNNRTEICELKYDYVYNFEYNFAKIYLNGKYGFINEKGKEICPIKYDSVLDFVNDVGVARVRKI